MNQKSDATKGKGHAAGTQGAMGPPAATSTPSTANMAGSHFDCNEASFNTPSAIRTLRGQTVGAVGMLPGAAVKIKGMNLNARLDQAGYRSRSAANSQSSRSQGGAPKEPVRCRRRMMRPSRKAVDTFWRPMQAPSENHQPTPLAPMRRPPSRRCRAKVRPAHVTTVADLPNAPDKWSFQHHA